MKIKKILLTIGLVLAGGVSALVGLNHVSSEPIAEAKADTTTSSTAIYVEVCDEWLQFNAVARLYAVQGSTNWIKPTTLKNADANQHALYLFNVPAGVSSFYLYRMNPDNPDNNSGVWNATSLISYSASYNYYNVTGLNGQDCPYTSGWMNAISRFYGMDTEFKVTIINEDYNWFDNNAITTIRFWDGTEIRFEKVIAYYGAAIYTNTLKCSTYINGGGTIYAAGFNIFRKSSDGSTTYSQTGNWTFTAENKDMNAFVVKAKTGDYAQFYDGGQSKVIGAEYNALAYSIFFLENTNSICSGKEENNNLSVLSAVWSKLEGAANASTNSNYLLHEDEEIAAFKTGSEYYTHDAFLRYSHIVGKYPSLTDFVGINPSAGSRLVSNGFVTNNNVIIIVTSLLVLSVAACAIIIIRRRKEN